LEKERRIVSSKVPGISARLAAQVTAFVQELRGVELYKTAGVSETLDWAAALVALNRESIDAATVEDTLGVLLKHREDLIAVKGQQAEALVGRALARP
jgi:MoxR-like ATPase